MQNNLRITALQAPQNIKLLCSERLEEHPDPYWIIRMVEITI